MRKTIPLLTLTVLIMSGLFLYNQYEERRIASALIEETGKIAESYDGLIEKNIIALQDKGMFTMQQRTAVEHMQLARKQFGTEMLISERVSLIHQLQKGIIAFLQDLQPEQAFVNSAEVALLQREMGKNGQMRALLTTYNELAGQWNDHQHTLLGNLLASLPGQKTETLPFLRFDGEQEYLTTIHL